jgi:drug/metabolite transporter (DMT)-like permease
MMFLGELAAMGTSFCWSGGSILFSIAGRRIGSYNVNKLRIPMAATFLFIALMVFYQTPFPTGINSHAVIYLGLSGIVGLVIGDTFYFRCLVILGPRQGSLMMSLAPVMTAVIAFLLIGETLSPMAIIGIVVTLAGVSWVTTDRKDIGSIDNREGSKAFGVLMGVGGAFGQALGLVLAKEGMGQTFNPLSATLLRMLTAAVAIWIVAGARREIITTLKSLADLKCLLTLSGAAFLGPTVGVWLSLVAVKNTEAGIAATLMSTFPVVIIPLTMIVHHERPSYRSVLGAIVAVAGVAMLFIE